MAGRSGGIGHAKPRLYGHEGQVEGGGEARQSSESLWVYEQVIVIALYERKDTSGLIPSSPLVKDVSTTSVSKGAGSRREGEVKQGLDSRTLDCDNLIRT